MILRSIMLLTAPLLALSFNSGMSPIAPTANSRITTKLYDGKANG